MTKEDKEILFKTLCMLLPYNVKCEVNDRGVKVIGTLNGYTPLTDGSKLFGLSNKEYDAPDKYWQPKAQFPVEEIKPCLRKLSNMTDEEKEEIEEHYGFHICVNEINIWYHTEGYWDEDDQCSSKDYLKLIDWLNEHHFDYNGLIDKGLAIEIKNN